MKIQLFIVVTQDNQDEWVGLIDRIEDFSGYDSIHLMYFGSQQELLRRFSRLMNKSNFYLHVCHSSVESQINYLVRKDCNYYVVVSRPNYNNLRDWPGKLVAKAPALVHPDATGIYNNMAVSTPLHTYLCGFGAEQTIDEKISIYCQNMGFTKLVFASKEEFFGRDGESNNDSTTNP